MSQPGDFPSGPMIKTLYKLNAGGMGSVPGGELRSHMPLGMAKNKKNFTASFKVILGVCPKDS